jgi:DNA polymerase-1
MQPVDFETEAIESRPNYPPIPVGVAVGDTYVSWGHPKNNNASVADGKAAVQGVWSGEIVCHNAAFDLAVAHEKLNLPLPDGEQINDTMIMAFLLEPYGELSLKPLAVQYLGMAPAEQDAVRDWLKANYLTDKGRAPTDKQCGALISKAPGDVVAPYASGDNTRSMALFKHFAPMLRERGLWSAYRRECEIMPMLLDNSARGIPLDHKRLRADTANYEAVLATVEAHLRTMWKREIGFTAPANFDSGDELADALQKNKKIKLPTTPTGRLSTAKEALMSALPDSKVKGLLLYRSALVQCLQMYMRPWVLHGEALHCNWNQVRDYSDYGAKTGRLSSSPNMQNTTNPDKYDELLAYMTAMGVRNKAFTLPNLRSYLVAPKGHVLFSRDYSQQELKFLAHYEDGVLAQAYRDNPALDVHDFVSELILDQSGIELGRKPTKTVNFAKIYGMGARGLALKLGITIDAAYALINAYDNALPSVKELQREVNGIGRSGNCVTTIGGRTYYSPAARIDKDTGSTQTYEYVLLNYLIQGSSADQTKEAMRLWWPQIRGTDTRFLLTVHDQLVGCAPKGTEKSASALLDLAMRNAFKLDVPVKTDPTFGQNFGNMVKPK